MWRVPAARLRGACARARGVSASAAGATVQKLAVIREAAKLVALFECPYWEEWAVRRRVGAREEGGIQGRIRGRAWLPAPHMLSKWAIISEGSD